MFSGAGGVVSSRTPSRSPYTPIVLPWTKRPTPAARQASSRAAVPWTLTERKWESGFLTSCWAAAKWISASTPSSTAAACASSVTDRIATSIPERADEAGAAGDQQPHGTRHQPRSAPAAPPPRRLDPCPPRVTMTSSLLAVAAVAAAVLAKLLWLHR